MKNVIFLLILMSKTNNLATQKIPEDGRLNFVELAIKYEHAVQEYDVVTEDGYILQLFRIPGDERRPVLLMHGILDSADTFIIRGNKSLVSSLVETGYDVWVGNCRGNKYSRRHIHLNPDTDKKFWDFSFHEFGYYDLPATIDTVLNKTGETSLNAVGFSQGTTIFYVLGATRPEYNDKIKVMIALAPVCFLRNIEPPMSTLFETWPIFNNILSDLGEEEIFGSRSIPSVLIKMICMNKSVNYEICIKGLLFAFFGEDKNELEQEFVPVATQHFPTSCSRKDIQHFSQIYQKNFTYFDYGSKQNMKLYNSAVAPNYDLSKVTMKMAFVVGKNDRISKTKDVDILRGEVKNIIDYHLMESNAFNHVNFAWGRHMDKYLFPYITHILSEFN